MGENRTLYIVTEFRRGKAHYWPPGITHEEKGVPRVCPGGEKNGNMTSGMAKKEKKIRSCHRKKDWGSRQDFTRLGPNYPAARADA